MAANILISACLLGHPVRYDGRGKRLAHALIDRWQAEGRLVAVCPELMGGFAVPRPAAEIAHGRDGASVLDGHGRVITSAGEDVTRLFVAGAEAALAVALERGCGNALLIDGSPSCGSRSIHGGAFDGQRHPGAGVTAALLLRHGIAVHADPEALARAIGELP